MAIIAQSCGKSLMFFLDMNLNLSPKTIMLAKNFVHSAAEHNSLSCTLIKCQAAKVSKRLIMNVNAQQNIIYHLAGC